MGKRKSKAFEIACSLIPDGEEIYDLGTLSGWCDSKKALFIATTERLLLCRLKFFATKREFDDFSWAKFRHLKIKEGWGSSVIELEFRKDNKTLRLEGLNKEQFRMLYRCARERITKYDRKFRISSKICPNCGEIINYLAKECPHCGNKFEPPKILPFSVR